MMRSLSWLMLSLSIFFFSSRRRHTRSLCDWSSDVCSSDLAHLLPPPTLLPPPPKLLPPVAGAGFERNTGAGGENRSEERRVGKESRSRRLSSHKKKRASTDGDAAGVYVIETQHNCRNDSAH